MKRSKLIKNKKIDNLEECQFIAAGFGRFGEMGRYKRYTNKFGMSVYVGKDWDGAKEYRVYIDNILVAKRGLFRIKFVHDMPEDMVEYVITELGWIAIQKNKFQKDKEKLIGKFEAKKKLAINTII